MLLLEGKSKEIIYSGDDIFIESRIVRVRMGILLDLNLVFDNTFNTLKYAEEKIPINQKYPFVRA